MERRQTRNEREEQRRQQQQQRQQQQRQQRQQLRTHREEPAVAAPSQTSHAEARRPTKSAAELMREQQQAAQSNMSALVPLINAQSGECRTVPCYAVPIPCRAVPCRASAVPYHAGHSRALNTPRFRGEVTPLCVACSGGAARTRQAHPAGAAAHAAPIRPGVFAWCAQSPRPAPRLRPTWQVLVVGLHSIIRAARHAPRSAGAGPAGRGRGGTQAGDRRAGGAAACAGAS